MDQTLASKYIDVDKKRAAAELDLELDRIPRFGISRDTIKLIADIFVDDFQKPLLATQIIEQISEDQFAMLAQANIPLYVAEKVLWALCEIFEMQKYLGHLQSGMTSDQVNEIYTRLLNEQKEHDEGIVNAEYNPEDYQSPDIIVPQAEIRLKNIREELEVRES